MQLRPYDTCRLSQNAFSSTSSSGRVSFWALCSCIDDSQHVLFLKNALLMVPFFEISSYQSCRFNVFTHRVTAVKKIIYNTFMSILLRLIICGFSIAVDLLKLISVSVCILVTGLLVISSKFVIFLISSSAHKSWFYVQVQR